MGKRIAKGLFVAAVLADCAMTAALLVKEFRHTAEARLDAKVERAMEETTREKYSKEPIATERRDFDEGEERKDPVDEGFENIMRYAVNGKTGFDAE